MNYEEDTLKELRKYAFKADPRKVSDYCNRIPCAGWVIPKSEPMEDEKNNYKGSESELHEDLATEATRHAQLE